MKQILETDRLILREFSLEDSKYIYKLHNDPDVMKYISSKQNEEIPLEECTDFITRCINYYSKHPGLGIWATVLKGSNEFIGWTTLKDLDSTDNIEIGYRYLKEYWGNGYATEASRALLNYGFNKIKLNKIVAVALKDNKASTKVMLKLGMKYIGMRRYYNADVVLYQIDKI